MTVQKDISSRGRKIRDGITCTCLNHTMSMKRDDHRGMILTTVTFAARVLLVGGISETHDPS